MNPSGDKLGLAHDAVERRDAFLKDGIFVGLVLMKSEGQSFTPVEQGLFDLLYLGEGAQSKMRDGLFLTRDQSAVALDALRKAKDYLRTRGVFEMRDEDDPWEVLSEIEGFVMPRGTEVADS